MSPVPADRVLTDVGLSWLSSLVPILQHWPLLTYYGFLLMASTSGCVVPIGPQFHDPPPATPLPEEPPYFAPEQTVPGLGTSVPLDTNKVTYFNVEIHDDNATDSVSVRWMTNYPPFTSGSTGHRSDATLPGPAEVFHFSESFNCGNFLNAADHTITILVADRPFLPPDKAPATDKENQYSYYDDNGVPKRVQTFGTWRITQCP